MKITHILLLILYVGLAAIFTACKPSVDNIQVTDAPQYPVIANEISNQQVNAFAEDAQGHIWIGTFRGLNKYDAYEFQQYYCTDDSLGPQDNQIKALLRDSKGQLWVSSVNGLSVYTDQDTFRHIPSDLINRNGLQLLETRDGRILLNTVTSLGVYNPVTGRLEYAIRRLVPSGTYAAQCHIDADNRLWVADPLSVRCYDSRNFVLQDSISVKGYPTHYYYDSNGKLWLAGNQSLQIFDCHSRSFQPVPEVISSHPVLSRFNVTLMHAYGKHGLLFNTDYDGLFYYDSQANTVSRQGEQGFPFEVPDFNVSAFFTDSHQNLWIGSTDQGYAVAYRYKERFNRDNFLRASLQHKSVVSVAADGNKTLWIATLSDGLYSYNLNLQKIEKVVLSGYLGKGNYMIYANQVLADGEGYIWLTTRNNEVLKCIPAQNRLQVVMRYDVYLPMSIARDKQGNILVGTATSYVYVLRPNEKHFTPIQVFNGGFTFIPGLLPLDDGTVLVAAFDQPLELLNPVTGEVKPLPVHKGDMEHCIRRSLFVPTALFRSAKGDIWIGTVSNGLLHYTPFTQRIEALEGTACTDISSIEEDREGNLWIGTQHGLSRLDVRTQHFTNFFTDDGIGGSQFYDRASCHLPDGTLALGGTHGLTFFDPLATTPKRKVPLLFENLKVHNRLIRPGSNACIERHLSYTPDIRLNYNQNGFSISFAALDYNEFERINYHYFLEGFDHYWIDARHNREAYYANLPDGTYTFHVRASGNAPDSFQAESTVRIIIRPAPWNTWWAWSLYLLAGVLLIGFFVQSLRRIRAEKAAICRAEQEKEQEQRINRMNMSFFANVSHEFRTPLTMIAGPVRQLCEAPDITGENKNLLVIVWRSVERMLRLVNQMMDFNKLENDALKLKVRPADIVGFLRHMTDVFRINAGDKGINLIITGLEDSYTLWLDEDKVEKIFTNLMGNALKFTPAGGKIRVSFDVITRAKAASLFPLTVSDCDTQWVEICVSNTGPSIPPAQRDKIFERYYQVNAPDGTGKYNYGTGIGLYYARNLVRLHHGYIKNADPDEGEGTQFIFILPVNALSYTDEERTSNHDERQEKAFPLPETVKAQAQPKEDTAEQDNLQTLLVVDDDTEIAHYLRALLSPFYRVICRFSADSALQTMQEEAPDLVLSDVVMPGKDGYAFCREIKSDLQLCHIPVILLTAKSSMDEQVKGLNIGADAYVTKPFDPDYLLALVRSQLDNRAKVRSLLGTVTQTDAQTQDMLLPQDASFMTDLYHLMENELSNPELDVARMTDVLKMSRTKFYYKVKGLTGENPSTFFKTYKLNRAAELIAEGRYTIAEVADMTGFSTPSRFTKNFKKQFDVVPSEYKGKQSKS